MPATVTLPPAQAAALELLAEQGRYGAPLSYLARLIRLRPAVVAAVARNLVARGLAEEVGGSHVGDPTYRVTEAGRTTLGLSDADSNPHPSERSR